MSRVGAGREREKAGPRATGVPRLAKPARHARYARGGRPSFRICRGTGARPSGRREVPVVHRRAAEPALRHQRIAGDVTHTLPGQALVQACSVAVGDGVEYQQLLPHSRAAVSAARIRAAPSPWRRARRCTSIFARSARCGWFSGWSSTNWTVPHRPRASSATSRARSPAATPRATRRQKPTARSRGRVHEAHRRAPFDAVDQHVGESVDLRVTDHVEPPDGPGGCRHRRAGSSNAITTA